MADHNVTQLPTTITNDGTAQTVEIQAEIPKGIQYGDYIVTARILSGAAVKVSAGHTPDSDTPALSTDESVLVTLYGKQLLYVEGANGDQVMLSV